MKTLRIARAEAGMTLKDLANASGVSLSNISKIERGVTRPQAVTLYKLASALGKTAAELAGEEEEPTRPKVLRPRSREELLSNAGIRSRWMLMPKEEFRGWWRGVSYEEARRRSEEIEAEYRVLEKATNDAIDPDREDAAKSTPELRAELRGAWVETLLRKIAASGQDPDVRESEDVRENEEDFYARQREGKRLSYGIHEPPKETPADAEAAS